MDADNLPSAVMCHLYRPHHHQMLAILYLLNLDSDKLRFLAVTAQNASGCTKCNTKIPFFLFIYLKKSENYPSGFIQKKR